MQTPLNPNAEAWVAALRSGDYNRGQSALHELVGGNRDKPLFCCLGVACDLFAQAHPDQGRWLPATGSILGFSTDSKPRELMYLPIEVSDWLGLKRLQNFNNSEANEMGEFFEPSIMGLKGHPTRKTLVSLNDEEDYSFKQIADVIESQPEGLFNA